MSFRKEFKYKLTLGELKSLKSLLIKDGMSILYPKRRVNSCYFDNKEYSLFFLSEEGILPRKKIRYRWYDNQKFITKEIKVSSIEGRYKIVEKAKDKYIFDVELCKICDSQYGLLEPKIIVSYDREYFRFKGIRLTVDKNIKYKDVGNITCKSINDFENVIEIKTDMFTSENYLEKIFHLQPVRFSKYTRGINLLQKI